MLVAPSALDAAAFVAELAIALDPAESQVARKLSSAQQRFSLALAAPDPLQDLFRRVAKEVGGTVALIDERKRIRASSGPLPLAAIWPELQQTRSPVVDLTFDAWSGAAARVEAAFDDQSTGGWLVALHRQPKGRDPFLRPLLQLAAPVFDSVLRLRDAALRQRRAVGSAVLAQALEFRPRRDSAEIRGELAALGLRFDTDLHVLVLEPLAATHSATATGDALERAQQLVSGALEDHDIRHLRLQSGTSVTYLVQAGVGVCRRIVDAERLLRSGLAIGLGRDIRQPADIAASRDDAVIALRMNRMARRPTPIVSSDDFDYALRLFSDVGLERLTEWARPMLAPILSKESLVLGVQAYFRHQQNVGAAADWLGIHHNSLRYRIARAEEALGISLRSPAALASVYLAITALELDGTLAPDSATVAASRRPREATSAAPESVAGAPAGTFDSLGVTRSG